MRLSIQRFVFKMRNKLARKLDLINGNKFWRVLKSWLYEHLTIKDMREHFPKCECSDFMTLWDHDTEVQEWYKNNKFLPNWEKENK